MTEDSASRYAQGFRVAGMHAGLKRDDRKDVALVVSDYPCQAAGVFTTNRVKAAPVLYDQEVLDRQGTVVRAIVANTGSANACTGASGLANAHQTAAHAAAILGCAPEEVLVLSTGVIGLPLAMDKLTAGIDALAGMLAPQAWPDAADAIMTTDTRRKLVSVTGDGYSITGIAKGAGMIAPNMATMLGVIVTDAAVPAALLDRALKAAVTNSFNRIVVDGDMSTNDTVLLLANGASGVAITDEAAFTAALAGVCAQLAQAIVRDGEGATKFVTLQVTGASTETAALTVARSIATSPLVKTAFYGADPNWGRVLAAAGYAGIELDPMRLSLWLMDAGGQIAIQLVEAGEPLDYDEKAAMALMQTSEWGMRLDLGQGEASTWVWTCDLSHDYVSINGHYRT